MFNVNLAPLFDFLREVIGKMAGIQDVLTELGAISKSVADLSVKVDLLLTKIPGSDSIVVLQSDMDSFAAGLAQVAADLKAVSDKIVVPQ